MRHDRLISTAQMWWPRPQQVPLRDDLVSDAPPGLLPAGAPTVRTEAYLARSSPPHGSAPPRGSATWTRTAWLLGGPGPDAPVSTDSTVRAIQTMPKPTHRLAGMLSPSSST